MQHGTSGIFYLMLLNAVVKCKRLKDIKDKINNKEQRLEKKSSITLKKAHK